MHDCAQCGLRGDRDTVAAVLASFVVFGSSGTPSSATVDYVAAASALPAIRSAVSMSYAGWQDTLSESTDLSAREGSFLTWWTSTPDPVVVARRSAGTALCPTLDEIGLGQTTPDRAWTRTGMFSRYKIRSYLRDKS
jgi:hypothetical protein